MYIPYYVLVKKDLLYSAENYTDYLVIIYMGKEPKKYICI